MAACRRRSARRRKANLNRGAHDKIQNGTRLATKDLIAHTCYDSRDF